MGSSNETSAYGPVITPVEAQRRRQCRADPGRNRRAGRRRRSRRGWRRASPAPTPAARSASPRPSPASAASSRPMAAARAGASSPSPRSLDQAGPMARDGARLRDPARGDGRLRPQGLDLARPAGAAVGSGLVERSQGQAGRHSRRNIGSTACPPRSTRSGTRASSGCATPAPRSVEISLPHTKYALPTYYIIAPGRGLVQPRPL